MIAVGQLDNVIRLHVSPGISHRPSCESFSAVTAIVQPTGINRTIEDVNGSATALRQHVPKLCSFRVQRFLRTI